MRIGWLICRILRRHKQAVFEFTGCKPSPTDDGGLGEPGIPVYRVSCPRCGISFLYGEDALAKDVIRALEFGGRYKGVKIVQYTSGYQPQQQGSALLCFEKVGQEDRENVCCPELLIVACSDTDEHCHLVCGYSKAILANATVKAQCIGDFSKCVLQGE